MSKELINRIVESGIKKSVIESEIGMPKNSLSGMLSGSKPMPQKWVDAITEYLDKIDSEQDSVAEPINEQKDVVEFVKPKPEIQIPKVSGIDMGAEVLSNTPKTLFQLLLIEFNSLVLDQPPVSKIKVNLEALIEKSQNSELTARQSEAIRERCINYIKGVYGVSVKKDTYNNSK